MNNNDSCLVSVRGGWGWLSSLCHSPGEDRRSEEFKEETEQEAVSVEAEK
jgi:hypothetical protein